MVPTSYVRAPEQPEEERGSVDAESRRRDGGGVDPGGRKEGSITRWSVKMEREEGRGREEGGS